MMSADAPREVTIHQSANRPNQILGADRELVLGAILTAAGTTRSEGHGALLLAFYSAGLAIPFLATSLAFGRMTTVFSWVKRHYGVIVFTGGAVLIAMGVLMWTGELSVLNTQAQNALNSLGINFIGI